MDFTLNLVIIFADQLMLFIVNMLVARHVGEALFGDFSVVTSSLLLISTLITLGIDSIIAYYIPKLFVHKKYDEITTLVSSVRGFLKPIYKTVLVVGMLVGIVLISVSQIFAKINLFDVAHPLFLFLWGAVILSLYNIYIQYFRAINYMRTAVVMSFFQTLAYFILSLFIYFYIYPALFHHDKRYFVHIMLFGFIGSYLFIVFCSALIQARSYIHRYKSSKEAENFDWKGKIYGYTVQNLNKYIFATIPLVVIEWLGHNEHSVGLFSATISIITLATIALAPIGILIGPEISAAFACNKEALKKVMQKNLIICFGVSVAVAIIMGFAAKHILVLYQSNFIDALPYTYACLINIVTYAISMPLSKMIQFSHEGSQIGAKLTINVLLFQLIASLIMVHWLGLLGAVICYIGINIVYNLTMIRMAIRIFRNEQFGVKLA